MIKTVEYLKLEKSRYIFIKHQKTSWKKLIKIYEQNLDK